MAAVASDDNVDVDTNAGQHGSLLYPSDEEQNNVLMNKKAGGIATIAPCVNKPEKRRISPEKVIRRFFEEFLRGGESGAVDLAKYSKRDYCEYVKIVHQAFKRAVCYMARTWGFNLPVEGKLFTKQQAARISPLRDLEMVKQFADITSRDAGHNKGRTQKRAEEQRKMVEKNLDDAKRAEYDLVSREARRALEAGIDVYGPNDIDPEEERVESQDPPTADASDTYQGDDEPEASGQRRQVPAETPLMPLTSIYPPKPTPIKTKLNTSKTLPAPRPAVATPMPKPAAPKGLILTQQAARASLLAARGSETRSGANPPRQRSSTPQRPASTVNPTAAPKRTWHSI
ncbi:hypothetical protein Dda_7012 [Drechslerella dactyloides]|uniref:Uncharacterized protein n=1 Tax=Drechslerella dactyloides TaxID=74499 RepID=A0AAD6NH90_DREDA|nr:hypothetical protein Dda_7012 [Drechslerella dactyloides]